MNSSLPYAGKWGVVKSSSGESLPSGAATSSHPYKIPQPPSISKYDSDFPLRKTGNYRLSFFVFPKKKSMVFPFLLKLKQFKLLKEKKVFIEKVVHKFIKKLN